MQLAWPIAHVAKNVAKLLMGRGAVVRLWRDVEGVVSDLIQRLRAHLLQCATRPAEVLLPPRWYAGHQFLDVSVLRVGVEAVERFDQVRGYEPNAISEIGSVVMRSGDAVADGDFDVVARHRHGDDEASINAIWVENVRDRIALGMVAAHASDDSQYQGAPASKSRLRYYLIKATDEWGDEAIGDRNGRCPRRCATARTGRCDRCWRLQCVGNGSSATSRSTSRAHNIRSPSSCRSTNGTRSMRLRPSSGRSDRP